MSQKTWWYLLYSFLSIVFFAFALVCFLGGIFWLDADESVRQIAAVFCLPAGIASFYTYSRAFHFRTAVDNEFYRTGFDWAATSPTPPLATGSVATSEPSFRDRREYP